MAICCLAGVDFFQNIVILLACILCVQNAGMGSFWHGIFEDKMVPAISWLLMPEL